MIRFAAYLLALTTIGLALGMLDMGEDVDNKSDLLSFKAVLSAPDPFHVANQVGAKARVRRGEVIRLQITGTPKDGYHTYPVTKHLDAQDPKGLTKLQFGSSKLVPQGTVKESEPEIVDEGPTVGLYYEHLKPFILTQDVLVHPEAKPGINILPIQIDTQICDKISCRPVHISLTAEVDVSPEEPLPIKGDVAAPKEASANAAKPPPSPAHSVAAGGLISSSHEQYQASMDAIAQPGPQDRDAAARSARLYAGRHLLGSRLADHAVCFPDDPDHGQLLPQAIGEGTS